MRWAWAAATLSTGELPPGLRPAARRRFGVGREVSKGKDTPSGHWEMAGVPVPFEWGYFPHTEPTFPADLIEKFIAEAKLPASWATSTPPAPPSSPSSARSR
jgi:phosphopentomutase